MRAELLPLGFDPLQLGPLRSPPLSLGPLQLDPLSPAVSLGPVPLARSASRSASIRSASARSSLGPLRLGLFGDQALSPPTPARLGLPLHVPPRLAPLHARRPVALPPPVPHAHFCLLGGQTLCVEAFSPGLLRGALELGQFGAQSLQFKAFGFGRVGRPPFGRPSLLLEPLRLTPFGLLTLHLEPVCLKAFLPPALPLDLLRLLSGRPSLGLDPRGPLGLGAVGRQFLRRARSASRRSASRRSTSIRACSSRSTSSRCASARSASSQASVSRCRSALRSSSTLSVPAIEAVVAAYEATASSGSQVTGCAPRLTTPRARS